MIEFADQEFLPHDAEGVSGESLLVGDRQVWIVVSPFESDPEICDWVEEQDPEDDGMPMRVCRAVLEDGMLILADAEPQQDVSMSSFLQRDRCGEA